MDITVLPLCTAASARPPSNWYWLLVWWACCFARAFSLPARADSLVSRNYDSVALARQMSTALAGWRFPELYVGKDRAAWQTEFELALAGARANVTETGEQAAVDAVARSWSELLLAGPEDADMGYNHVRMQLNALVASMRMASGKGSPRGAGGATSCSRWALPCFWHARSGPFFRPTPLPRALPIHCAARPKCFRPVLPCANLCACPRRRPWKCVFCSRNSHGSGRGSASLTRESEPPDCGKKTSWPCCWTPLKTLC